MVKFINILFVVTLLFSCKKDKVELPTFLSEDYQFIEGEWEWKQSVICWGITSFPSYSGQKFFIYKEDIPEYCKLNFSSDGTLIITTQNGSQTKKLAAYGVIKIGANRIVHFKSSLGEVFTFSWSNELNRIETEHAFFTFPGHACNTGFLILNNSYEKI